MPFSEVKPLSQNDLLYCLPKQELERLVSACCKGAQSIWLVQGDFRMGKTSFFNATASELARVNVVPCQVQFSPTSGKVFPDLLKWLAEQVWESTRLPCTEISFQYGTDFLRFLNHVIEQLASKTPAHQPPRLALLLDNVSRLERNVLDDFASVLVELIDDRSRFQGLNWVTVIITGGVYLESLDTRVSTLNDRIDLSQSTTLILPELDQHQCLTLVQNGLQDLNWLAQDQVTSIGDQIYSKTHGHPALIHSIGGKIYSELEGGKPVNGALVDDAAEFLAGRLAMMKSTFRSSLERAQQDWHLLDDARSLVRSDMQYSRNDPVIRRLEILGLVKQHNGRCVLRNEIFRKALEIWR